MHDTTALTCGATAGSCSAVAVVRDLIGYGSATDFEGAAAPALSNTTAAIRGSNGCDDTDANDTDFTTDTPAPRTTSSAATTVQRHAASGRLRLGNGERRARPAVDALDRAREADAELRQRLSRRLARSAHRPHHRHEHERAPATRSAHTGAPSRPPTCRSASPRRPRPAGSSGRPSPAVHGPPSRSPRPPTCWSARRRRRAPPSGDNWPTSLAFTSPLPTLAVGPLHGHRHLHGDRPVTGASLLVAAPATAVALALAAVAPAPPRPALTASPGRVVLDGAARATVHVAAPRGTELVDVALAPYALDLRGHPRLGGAARAPRWVSARPASLRVGPKGAVVTLAAGAASRSGAGRPAVRPRPHDAERHTAHGVAVRLRIGVLVLAHVPGRAVRRLVIGPLARSPGRERAHPRAGDPERRQRHWSGSPRAGSCSRCSAADTSSRACVHRAASCCRTAARSSRRASAGRFAGLRRCG